MFMKFKKKLIEENKVSVSELVDLEGDFIQGNEKTHWDSEIKTGPINKPTDSDSDYVKGLSTTTDKQATYSNPRNWWSMLFGSSNSVMTRPMMTEDEMNETEKLRSKIMELLNTYSKDRSFVNKNADSGLNQIPSIDALDDPALISKVNDLLLALNNKNPETVNQIVNFLQQSIKK